MDRQQDRMGPFLIRFPTDWTPVLDLLTGVGDCWLVR